MKSAVEEPPTESRLLKNKKTFLLLGTWLLTALLGLLLLISLWFNQPRLHFEYTAQQLADQLEQGSSTGFYPSEVAAAGEQYVWTKERATIQFNFRISKSLTMLIELRSAATAGGRASPVTAVFNGTVFEHFQPNPTDANFQSFSLKIQPEAILNITQPLKLELVSIASSLPNDNRELGTMVKSLTLDQSEAWSIVTRNLWLFWALPGLVLLVIALIWSMQRYQLWLLGYLATTTCLLGAGFMATALILFSEVALIDTRIYLSWQSTILYWLTFFGVSALMLFVYTATKHKSYYHLKLAYHRFNSTEASNIQVLAEFYRYSWLALLIFVLAAVVIFLWNLTVMPAEWLNIWLPFIVFCFGLVLVLGIRQAWQGYRSIKLYPRWQLTIAGAELSTQSLKTARQFNQKAVYRLPIWACWLIIFGLGLAFNLWINSFRVQWLIGDAGVYDFMARSIVGRGFVPHPDRPPGYPVLLSYLYRQFGNNYYPVCFFIQQLIASCNGVLVFALGLLVTGKRSVGWVGGLLCALYPFIAGYSAALLTEPLAIFLFTASVYLIVLIIKRPGIILYYALLGMTVTFLLEVRFNYRLFFVVAAFLIFAFPKLKWKIKLGNMLFFLLMVFIVHNAVLVSNYKEYKQFVPFAKTDSLSIALWVSTIYDYGHWFLETKDLNKSLPLQRKYLNSQTNQVNYDAYLKEYLERYKWDFTARVVPRVWQMWQQTFVFPYSFPLPNYFDNGYGYFLVNLNRFYLLFALTGVWFIGILRRTSLAIVLNIAYVCVVQLTITVEARYVLPVYPTILFLTAVGLVAVFKSANSSWQSWRPAKKYQFKLHSPNRNWSWLLVPLVSLILVVTLSSVIDNGSYDATYSLQFAFTEAITGYAVAPYSYFDAAIPQIIEDVKATQAMPQTNRLGIKSKFDLYLAMLYLRNNDYVKSIQYFSPVASQRLNLRHLHS